MITNWRTRVYQAYVTSGQANFRDASQAFAERAPYIQSIIAKHIPSDKSAPILDLGCGYGAFIHFLKQAGYNNLAGVDFSQEQIEVAHQLGIKEVSYGTLEETLANKQDASLEVILAMDILEHLDTPELFDTLDEIYRVLRPGGKIIATVPNGEGLYGMRIMFGDITHYTAFTPQSISQILKVIGFSEINCFENKPVAHGTKSWIRRLIWDIGTLPHRLLLTAEIGSMNHVLTQTMLFSAYK